MVALIAGNAEIAEEVELGRTLLVQGHLDTAQRVLLKVCQDQPECAEAFRVLGLVLSKRGDDTRARSLTEYADDLDAAGEIPLHVDDVASDAETRRNKLGPKPALRPVTREKEADKPVASRQAAAVNAPRAEPRPRVLGPVFAATPAATPVFPPAPVPAPAPTPAPPATFASIPVPAPVPAVPPADRARHRRGGVFFAVFLGVAMVGGSVVAYRYYKGARTPRLDPRLELDRSLAAGTLDALMRGRDVARIAGEPDFDVLARLGLVNAFLVLDYDVDARKDAEYALNRVVGGPEASKDRTSLAEAARSLLALAKGDRATAKQHAEIAVSALTPDTPAYALLASARVRNLAGDATGAARDLDRAIGLSGDLAPILVDWAGSRLDCGDPVAARRALIVLLDKHPEYSRARLLLADAERALGEPSWSKNLEQACRSDVKISRNVRAACAVGVAVQARLEGDRAGALRKVKAAAQTTEDPQALAQMALLLGILGEADLADDLLGRAGKSADPSVVALRWADLAIRLSRGEAVQSLPDVENPAGPERDLVAMRAAYARSGTAGLSSAIKALPPGIQDIDWDLRIFAMLAREGGPPKPELLAIEKRADRGNPIASYVLGLLAIRDKEWKTAARRLEKALALHGDACAAASLYWDAVSRAGRGVQANKAGLRGLHGRNAKCPLPEM